MLKISCQNVENMPIRNVGTANDGGGGKFHTSKSRFLKTIRPRVTNKGSMNLS